MWAATWLYMATRKTMYMKYIQEETISANVTEFSWDLKYAGVQVLLSQLHFECQNGLETFKAHGQSYICSVISDSPYNQIKFTPGKSCAHFCLYLIVIFTYIINIFIYGFC